MISYSIHYLTHLKVFIVCALLCVYVYICGGYAAVSETRLLECIPEYNISYIQSTVRIQRREFCFSQKVRFVLCLERASYSHLKHPSPTSADCYFLSFHLLSLLLHLL